MVGAFLAPLDFFIVNVAMPAMSADLKASSAEMQLVISGYAIVFAVFLITGGRLGDIFGRKAVFMIGLAGFAVASMICGLAGSPSALIAGRLLQALAAAAMAPQAIASVHALFPPHERARALSIYGITIGCASIAGQLLGGALVAANLSGFGWRLIFLINLPISIGAFVAAIPLLRDTRGATRPRLDFGGVVLSAAALTALVLPLIEGRELGWPWWTIATLLTAPVFAEAFRRYEIRLARRGGEPLVAMDVFKSPGVLRGLGAMATLYALAAFFLTFSIWLQEGLGRSALAAGIAILPLSVGFLVGIDLQPRHRRLRRAGRRPPSDLSLQRPGCPTLSALVALAPAGQAPPFPLFAPALLIIGLGMGIVGSDPVPGDRRSRRSQARRARGRHDQFDAAGECGDRGCVARRIVLRRAARADRSRLDRARLLRDSARRGRLPSPGRGARRGPRAAATSAAARGWPRRPCVRSRQNERDGRRAS